MVNAEIKTTESIKTMRFSKLLVVFSVVTCSTADLERHGLNSDQARGIQTLLDFVAKTNPKQAQYLEKISTNSFQDYFE